MDYRLENIDSSSFERLINRICQKILGTGVIEFSPGPDGGRDGKFTGKATKFPSSTDCWEGKFIIQAKHTINPIASCSDNDFKNLLDKEIKKIKKLVSQGDLDNYLLFTNRKYTGVVGEELTKKIQEETQIENCQIIGKETINNGYLNPNKIIVKEFKLDLAHIPFDFSDEEIKEIIVEFKEQLSKITPEIKKKAKSLKQDFDYIKKEKKNKKNNLSRDYFDNFILSDSLNKFNQIEEFLNDPINSELKDYYFDTASELQQIIYFKRDNFKLFEEFFLHIYRLICDGSTTMKGNKRFVMTFLHFMYFECLIGKK